jgi:hypothetical protein
MKCPWFCAVLACLSATFINAQPIEITQPSIISVPGTTVTRTATIQLGTQLLTATFVALPPQPPLTFIAGTRLQFAAPQTSLLNPVIQWFKDGKQLDASSSTFEIASATAADSGRYSATVTSGSGSSSVSVISDIANVLITHSGPRLLCASTRARIDAAQPAFLTGFVIESGPANAVVLVRAIGPTLANFGVKDALGAPQLHLFDAAGNEVFTPISTSYVSAPLFVPTEAAQRVGAFPLPTGTKDYAQVFSLPPGAYTAQLTSADGGAGTALLEIYEVPL